MAYDTALTYCNYADARRQVIADHLWKTVQGGPAELELLDISNQILALTKEVRAPAER